MREVKQGDETKKVSYHPARYSHDYQFDYLINVNNPYFDDMKFRLNRSTVTIEPVIAGTMFDPMLKPEYARYQNIANEITAALTGKGAQAAEEPAAAPRVVICPYCKAETEVGASGRCEYCGGYIADKSRARKPVISVMGGSQNRTGFTGRRRCRLLFQRFLPDQTG